ncbi:MAG: helix-turn-helix transcriptional regulator [Pseudomonadota bacterium]
MSREPVVSILRELGIRIRVAREAAKLTQEEAASRAGIDYKRWQRLEAGTVNATVRTLVRVAGAVGEDFWTLLAAPVRHLRRRE